MHRVHKTDGGNRCIEQRRLFKYPCVDLLRFIPAPQTSHICRALNGDLLHEFHLFLPRRLRKAAPVCSQILHRQMIPQLCGVGGFVGQRLRRRPVRSLCESLRHKRAGFVRYLPRHRLRHGRPASGLFRIGQLEHMAHAIGTVLRPQQRDPLAPFLNPAIRLIVPILHGRARRGVRPLGVNQQLVDARILKSICRRREVIPPRLRVLCYSQRRSKRLLPQFLILGQCVIVLPSSSFFIALPLRCFHSIIWPRFHSFVFPFASDAFSYIPLKSRIHLHSSNPFPGLSPDSPSPSARLFVT